MRRTIAVVVTLGLFAGAVSIAAADAARTVTPLTTDGVREGETTLGDLVADSLMAAGKAQAALVSAAQFGSGTIEPGKVTAADVAGLLLKPTRHWVISNFTGETLRAGLERSLSRAPNPSAHFLQVAGIKVEFDPNGAPDERITKLTIKGAPVQDAATYRVALPEDLAQGGSGYFTVPGWADSQDKTGDSGTMSAAISKYLDAHPAIDYTDRDRIK